MNAERIVGSLRDLAERVERAHKIDTPVVTMSPGEITCKPTRDGEYMVLEIKPADHSVVRTEVHLLLTADVKERLLRALSRA